MNNALTATSRLTQRDRYAPSARMRIVIVSADHITHIYTLWRENLHIPVHFLQYALHVRQRTPVVELRQPLTANGSVNLCLQSPVNRRVVEHGENESHDHTDRLFAGIQDVNIGAMNQRRPSLLPFRSQLYSQCTQLTELKTLERVSYQSIPLPQHHSSPSPPRRGSVDQQALRPEALRRTTALQSRRPVHQQAVRNPSRVTSVQAGSTIQVKSSHHVPHDFSEWVEVHGINGWPQALYRPFPSGAGHPGRYVLDCSTSVT